MEGFLMFHVEQNNRTLYEELEFDKILFHLSAYCKSDATRKEIFSIRPLKSIEEIIYRQGLLREVDLLSDRGNPLNILSFQDISEPLKRVKLADSVLEPKEIYEIAIFLKASLTILSQIKENPSLRLLNDLVSFLSGQPQLLKLLQKTVDREGNILDDASYELSELRKGIRRLEQKIRSRLQELIKKEEVAKFLQDNFITQRSGRWVLPIRMDSKGQVPGVVHDISKSGETAFIEPLSIIGLSNELENLIAEAKAEEIRILRRVSNQIRSVAIEIESEFKIITFIDMLNALSCFSRDLKMGLPTIGSENKIILDKARHTLLEINNKSVVPLDINLGTDSTVMVITGPNSGGKTITIKTIGLLTLMALSGMPISADSSSYIPFVKEILIDIGDRQSIENNLSTFSAHISTLSEIVQKASQESLILIDELGTGTDPEEGSALACAILKELRDKRSLTFVTTHLTEIKVFAHKNEGMINASMEFDQKTFTPLYRLKIGEPGYSYAFQTAKRFGLPDHIIGYAQSLIGTKNIELDSLLRDLHQKKRYYESEMQKIHQMEEEIRKKEELIERTLSEAELKNKEVLLNAYKKAEEIITITKRQAYSIMEEIKKRDRTEIKDAIKRLEKIKNTIQESVKEIKGIEHPSLIDHIKEGDTVYISPYGTEAYVVRVLDENRLKVRKGNIEFEVNLAQVSKVSQVVKESGSINVELKDEAFISQINLLGLKVEDALSRLEKFLNRAFLSDISEVKIIHGIGTGALLRAIKDYLSGHPLIKDFRKAREEEGGLGVTIAMLSLHEK
jgi:DNA mismatch repair protein MutS2